MGKLIIDGNSVYEIDEECMKKRKVSQTCEIEQALKKLDSLGECHATITPDRVDKRQNGLQRP